MAARDIGQEIKASVITGDGDSQSLGNFVCINFEKALCYST